MLQTFTVAEHTLVLLKQIQQIPMFAGLRLVGGTALALQLGHRSSIDLDFFGDIDHSHEKMLNAFESMKLNTVSTLSTKRIHHFVINDVKVDIVNYPYGWIDVPIVDDGVTMASLKDIAAMKLSAITNRGTKKDFVDIYFLLQHFSLSQMLEFYLQKYHDGTKFNVIRSLTYFVDAEEMPMPVMFAKADWTTITTAIRNAVATL
jgi:predicted nucleotidyltransferase component of viral defense system